MSNFALLQADWPLMFESAMRVEETANTDVYGDSLTDQQLRYDVADHRRAKGFRAQTL